MEMGDQTIEFLCRILRKKATFRLETNITLASCNIDYSFLFHHATFQVEIINLPLKMKQFPT